MFALGVTACSQPADEPPEGPAAPSGDSHQEPDPGGEEISGQSIESLGGVRLGMTIGEVDSLLDEKFTQRTETEGGYFGEPLIIRQYDNGCHLVIGKNTGEVLQIDVYSPAYPTNLGVKVGDPSIEALELYREKYPEFVGYHSPDKLAGWFETEPGTLLIFSSMENRERSNENLTEDSKIHGITLGRAKFFD